jgi:hypothetical protein
MLCLGETDRRPFRVHQLGWIEFGAPDEVERMVLPFTVSA